MPLRFAFCCLFIAAVTTACRSSKQGAKDNDVTDQSVLRAVGAPLRIASGAVTARGHVDLVTADAQWLRVTTLDGREAARLAVPGGIEVLRVADLDGDGLAEILTGWGQTREHPQAKARASVYRFKGGSLVEDVVLEPTTSRNDIVEILPYSGQKPSQLLVAYFESKYIVRISNARRAESGWVISPVDAIRMATSFGLGDVDGDGSIDLVVGRLYGDDIEADGDAFVLRPDGSRVPIPTNGGVRSLSIADIDGDGHSEVLIADGWKRDYGKSGRARLTRASWSAGGFRTEVIDESPAEYTFWDILRADLDGDGASEIVLRGSGQVTVLRRKDHAWQSARISSACRDIAAVNYDGHPGDELILVCDDGTSILRNGRDRVTLAPATPH